MTAPVVLVRMDWARKGDFSGAFDTVNPLSSPEGSGIAISGGASADFTSEAIGQVTFDLDNVDHRYDVNRNWLDNPSFELGTAGWSTEIVPVLINAAATSLTQVTDNAGQGGTKAAEAVLTATLNSGVHYLLPYMFLAGVPYTFSIYIKSISGTTSIRVAAAPLSNTGDFALTDPTITGSWARYTLTWTPAGNYNDVIFYVQTRTAAAATIRLDAGNVNPGTTANAYVEAPTRGMLDDGIPVHISHDGTQADFYGFTERISPDPEHERVSVSCYDVLRRYQDSDVAVRSASFIARSARDLRLAILGDYERGDANLLPNPSFEVNTNGWLPNAGTLTRTAGDHAVFGSNYGSYVMATTCLLEVPAWNAPIVFADEPYHFSVYLRVASGTLTGVIGMSGASLPVSPPMEKAITVDTVWRRFDFAAKVVADALANAGDPLRGYLRFPAGTLRVDDAAITRGPSLLPYSPVGTGRLPDYVGNGSFDGGTTSPLQGWDDLYTNLVANPSFETNTTGWTNVTRQANASSGGYGSFEGKVNALTVATFSLAGISFPAGVPVRVSVSVRSDAGAGGGSLVIRSAGTTSDNASIATGVPPTTFTRKEFSWTPAATRTDVEFRYDGSGNGAALYLDGLMVTIGPSVVPAYSGTGPGGGGSRTTPPIVIVTGAARHGYRNAQAATPAATGAGRYYDLSTLGGVFIAGHPYTLMLSLKPSSSMPYQVGIGGLNADGTWDEATATGTLTANVWTDLAVTLTPSGDHTLAGATRNLIWFKQTDATARNIDYDSVRVIAAGAADDVEMDQWDVSSAGGEALDIWSETATARGSTLQSLAKINELTLSRHWIRPLMAAPWYQYVVEDRDTYAAKTSLFEFGDPNKDVDEMTDFDLDLDSVVNTLVITDSDADQYYGDEFSAAPAKYGPRILAIDGAGFYPDRTLPDQLAPIILRRNRLPRMRPRMTISQHHFNHLDLELSSLIQVTMAKHGLYKQGFVIVRVDHQIDNGARTWLTTYTLEEYTG